MAPPPAQSAKIEEAQKLRKTDPLKAEAIYKEILSQKPGGNEASLREYESALMGLGESYRDTKKPSELAELVKSSTSSLSSFTKAKTAKLGKIGSQSSTMFADMKQYDSYLICFLPSQIPSISKYLSPSHV